MGKDAYYFKHDSNARNDPKIQALIHKYGIEGYGRYWVILEMFRDEATYKLEDKSYVWKSIAQNIFSPEEEARKFIKDCIEEFELFIQDDGFFYSASFLLRMQKLDEIRAKRSRAGEISGEKRGKIEW